MASVPPESADATFTSWSCRTARPLPHAPIARRCAAAATRAVASPVCCTIQVRSHHLNAAFLLHLDPRRAPLACFLLSSSQGLVQIVPPNATVCHRLRSQRAFALCSAWLELLQARICGIAEPCCTIAALRCGNSLLLAEPCRPVQPAGPGWPPEQDHKRAALR
jgi:hypothetical protein